MTLRIISYLPHHIKSYGIGYAAHSLALGMNNNDVQSDIFSIHSDYADKSKHVKQAFKSRLFYKLILKLCKNDLIRLITEYKFRRLAIKYDVICLWPGASIVTFEYLKRLGKIVIIENINCHQQQSRMILDQEAERMGLTEIHNITDADIADENAKILLADFIFSPSPQVAQSLIAADVPEHKIIHTSYGLREQDYHSRVKRDDNQITALYVGSIIPRKGVHLLLDYWQTARPSGKLKLIGQVAANFEKYLDKYKNDSTIQFIPFTDDLASHYRSADVFLMPSLEEGSPLVTYLAIGAGLACIVSPMAGDNIISDDIEGYIIDPHNKAEWVKNIQKLMDDSSVRKKFEIAARRKAYYFLWSKVAQRRANEILYRLSKHT